MRAGQNFSWALPWVMAAVLCACEPSPPTLRLTRLNPASGPVDRDNPVVLEGSGFAVKSFTNFGDPLKSTADDTYTLTLGATPLTGVTRTSVTSIEAVVPAGLPLGPSDLVLTDPWGRQATLAQAWTTLPPPAEALAFTTPNRTVTAGKCSPANTVQSRDSSGAVAAPTTDAPVTLTASMSGVTFFADATCSTPLTAAMISAGTTDLTFYVIATKAATAGGLVITADVTGWTSDTVLYTVNHAPLTSLGIVAGSLTIVAGVCSPLNTIQSQDQYGNPVAVSGPTDVTLSGAPGPITFYSNAACTSVQTTPRIGNNATQVSFYFKAMTATAAGGLTITATSAPLTPGTQTFTVNPNTATVLAFLTPSSTVLAGACSPQVTVESRDVHGNASAPTSDIPVTLSGAPGTVTFYSDSACTSALSAPQIASGSTQLSFYFTSTTATAANGLTLTAQATSWTSGTRTFTVTPAPPAALAFTTPTATVIQGACSGVNTVQARDPSGNASAPSSATSVVLTPSLGSVTFYSDGGCTTPLSPVQIAGGATDLSFWFKSARAGTLTIAAQVPSWTQTIQSFGIAGAAPLAALSTSAALTSPGVSVTLDASASTDVESAPSALEFSWDFENTGTWTAWSTTPTTPHSFAGNGDYEVTVAVRDEDGIIGFASRLVAVRDATSICVVNSAALVDNAVADCSAPTVSLIDAINHVGTTPNITFSAPMTISGSAGLEVPAGASLYAPAGTVSLSGEWFTFTGAGSNTVAGLSFLSQATPLNVGASRNVQFFDAQFTSQAGVIVAGGFSGTRLRMTGCTTHCLDVRSPTQTLSLQHSTVANDSASAVFLNTCTGSGTALDLVANVFTGNSVAVLANCGARPMSIRNNTFHNNARAVVFISGAGHDLRNNVFTSQTTRAIDCGTATFANRSDHLFFQNVAIQNGCSINPNTDPNTLNAVDPLYVDAAANDLRLRSKSPAVDTATDLAIDLDGAAPGNYLGLGPDRGGRESF